ncbi:MAG: tetratricopeptide repeat protein [Candidatus Coatesbacteria bacterium]|nr:tetratricopeptide repeat protein [Candidatus Coatesbacteria bacterium]
MDDQKQEVPIDPDDESLKQILEHAESCSMKGMYEASIGWYNRALEIKENDKEILSNIGLAYLKNRNFNKAAEIFRKICIKEDYIPDKLLFYLAYTQDNLGKQQAAERYYKQYLKYFPNDLIAMNNLAVVLKRMGLFTEAEEVLESILVKDLYNRSANLNLAYIYRKTHRYEKAKGLVEKLLTVNDADTKLRVFLEEMKEEEAQTKHNKEDVYYYNALSYVKENKHKQALEELNKALQTTPKSHKIHEAFGLVYESMQEYEIAWREYEKSLSFATGNLNALDALIRIGKLLNKDKEVLSYLRKLVYESDRKEKYQDLYITELISQKAWKELERWSETFPETDYTGQAWLGYSYCMQDRMGEGITLLDYTFEYLDNLEALYQTAAWFHEGKNLKRSSEIYRFIISQWNGELKAYALLAEVLRGMEQYTQAAEVMAEAFRIQNKKG